MPQITKPFLQALRIDMNAALAAVAEKHGIAVRVGNCTFGASTATFKVEIAELTEGASASDPHATQKARAAADWKGYASMLPYQGMDAGMLHKSIAFGGKVYRIEGYLPKGQRFPILASVDNGSRLVKLSIDHLKAGKPVEA